MSRVNREELLAVLESVQPGLSVKSELDQSTCFAFVNGRCVTFNGEVACQAKSPLNGVEGAVHAGPLLSVLRKMPEDEIEVKLGSKKSKQDQPGEDHLFVKGKGRTLGVRMDAEILMPLDQLETPTKWRKLDDEFSDALKMVQDCCGGKKADFVIACVHITPDYLEASDNRQMIRYQIKTGVSQSVLIKQTAASHVAMLGASEVSETESWLHFRNSAGVTIACRRFVEEFKDIGQQFKDMTGQKAVLPKALAAELDNAEVFTSEDADRNLVEIKLMPGKVRVRGEGVTGFYSATKNVEYRGKELTFYLPPSLLRQIVQKHNAIVITDDKIKVKGGKWRYVTALSVADNGTVEE